MRLIYKTMVLFFLTFVLVYTTISLGSIFVQAVTRRVKDITDAEEIAWNYLQSFASPSILGNPTLVRSDDYMRLYPYYTFCYRYISPIPEGPEVQEIQGIHVHKMFPFYVRVYANGTAWMDSIQKGFLQDPNEVRVDTLTALQKAEQTTGKNVTKISLWISGVAYKGYPWKNLTAEGSLSWKCSSEPIMVTDKNETDFWSLYCMEHWNAEFTGKIILHTFVDATTGEIIAEGVHPGKYVEEQGFLQGLQELFRLFLAKNWLNIALSVCVAVMVILFLQIRKLRGKILRVLRVCVSPASSQPVISGRPSSPSHRLHLKPQIWPSVPRRIHG